MRKAFTLIELLVVFGAFAVLAVVATENLFGGGRLADLNTATQTIISTARDAQVQAVGQDGDSAWGIHFSNATNTHPFFLIFAGSSYASGTPQATYPLPGTVSFISSTVPLGGSTDILFSPISGMASASTTIGLYVTSEPSLTSYISFASSGLIYANGNAITN